MSPQTTLFVLIAYFGVLFFISWRTSRGATTETFFTANRNAPWYLVAFGMIGASLSGVTFISVPGQVGANAFSYMQIVFGYLLGYLVIATVLLPLYYKHNLTSIYEYLNTRFGFWSYKTGASFFILSRIVGSAFRLFLAAGVLQIFLFEPLGIPFEIAVFVTIILVLLYTFQGGIKTIVWTDTLQTLFMLLAVGITIVMIGKELGLNSISEIYASVSDNSMSKTFFWDMNTPKNFYKQFLGGAFIAITMTGLDQDMMQKNLSCKTLKESQKNIFWFSIVLVFVNLLFLAMGALLYMYAGAKGIEIPEATDMLYPIIAKNHLPALAGILFLIGIIAAAYSSADSALTALTTSFCVDFLGFNDKDSSNSILTDKNTETKIIDLPQKQVLNEQEKKSTRLKVQVGFAAVLFFVIVALHYINDRSVIDGIFTAAGYTYGPLLGLYAFGMFTKIQIKDNFTPFICVIAPIITFSLVSFINNSPEIFGGYKIGYEAILINGGLTFLGLLLAKK
ncbi:sodium:solute symporter [Bernardetia sp. OM2101]|uniref:sodium:solute symporter n=1 Tax=Bernardetia sp. OM2101 TaxID=3344876 RepID=UPI0035CE9179